jgi:hypothetical protein
MAGQNRVSHVKYIAVVKGARWRWICDKKFLEEDLG